MRYVYIFIFLMISEIGVAQSEKPVYKLAADCFEQSFNDGRYEQIFDQFSDEMKKALPLEKSNVFFSGLKADAGAIKKREFLRYQSIAALYKVTFDRSVFLLSLAVDAQSKISGLYIKPYVPDGLPVPERTKTRLSFPAEGVWTVVWGGDTPEQNYHVQSRAQKNAIDLIITDKKGKSFRTDGRENSDYYAFGQELTAPCPGEVVLVVDGVKDNKPGEFNSMFVPGNTVILKTDNREFLVFAHFKQYSIRVKQGDRVQRGDLLGLCGNTGNSSEPHIHFHVQNTENMDLATGVKCFFDTVCVNGTDKRNYSPVRTDKIGRCAGSKELGK